MYWFGMTETTGQEGLILLKKKADAYWLLATKVHVPFKSGHWKRGFITDVKTDFFIINETLEGKVPVFYEEIKDIRPFVEKEVKG